MHNFMRDRTINKISNIALPVCYAQVCMYVHHKVSELWMQTSRNICTCCSISKYIGSVFEAGMYCMSATVLSVINCLQRKSRRIEILSRNWMYRHVVHRHCLVYVHILLPAALTVATQCNTTVEFAYSWLDFKCTQGDLEMIPSTVLEHGE